MAFPRLVRMLLLHVYQARVAPLRHCHHTSGSTTLHNPCRDGHWAIAFRIALSIRTPRRLKPSMGMISSMIDAGVSCPRRATHGWQKVKATALRIGKVSCRFRFSNDVNKTRMCLEVNRYPFSSLLPCGGGSRRVNQLPLRSEV